MKVLKFRFSPFTILCASASVLIVVTYLTLTTHFKWLRDWKMGTGDLRETWSPPAGENIGRLDWTSFELSRKKAFFGRWWEHFVVDRKNRIVYCINRKSASVTLLKYLIKMDRIDEISEEELAKIDQLSIDVDWEIVSNIRPLHTFETKQAKFMMSSYKKITWVRDPLSRLLSAWNDWMYSLPIATSGRSDFRRQLQQFLEIQKISEPQSLPNISVSFHDMIEVMRKTSYLEKNSHWEPMNKACHLDKLHFDFIGHWEHIYDDWDKLGQMWGIYKRKPQLPPATRYASGYEHKTVYKLASQQVPRSLLEGVLIEYYSKDYAIFGYDMKRDLDILYT